MTSAESESGASLEGDGALSLEEIHDRIRDSILSGELGPGKIVSQVSLARELGIGRTPLREALRMLQHEGLIEAETNRRVRIAPFSVEDLEQLYAMRISLEALACRLTVSALTDADLGRLDASLAEMDECVARDDLVAWREPHRRFHHILVQNAGERLVRTVSQLSDHAERYRHLKLVQDGLALSAGSVEHHAIGEACHAHDTIGASNRLAQHLARTALTVIMMVSPGHDPAAVRRSLALVVGDETSGFGENAARGRRRGRTAT
jgi:GntR family transcriptional regulator, rspAB operon transcriptional repressor